MKDADDFFGGNIMGKLSVESKKRKPVRAAQPVQKKLKITEFKVPQP